MKRLVFVVFILFLTISVFFGFKYKLNKDLSQPVKMPKFIPNQSAPSAPPIVTKNKMSRSLFVPYWSLQGVPIDASGFDKLIYFGIKTDKTGVDMTSAEVKQLEKFNELRPGDIQAWLALRMTDTGENFIVLKDVALQQKIIDQTIQIAMENDMKGIVLDLEVSAIPFESLVKQINKFTGMFYESCKKSGLTFGLTIYGDAFYRARPYDVKILAENADTIMIMAYDLHKAKGSPGPNFPLKGHEEFGYDLNQMTDDFLEFVPAKKITVIFGLFGYDWTVDKKGNSLQEAQALSFAQIQNKFINKCEFNKCVIKRNKDATESQIVYTDHEDKDHIVWFEDMESVKKKIEYLKQKGINSFSYWAYSYF